MARDQRLLKFFLRLMLPVFALGGFGGVWGLVLVGMNQEREVSAVWSQDNHYRASVIRYSSSGGCGRNGSSLVLVERRNLFLKTGEFIPFCLDDEPERISLQWIDPETLAIGCNGCGDKYGYADENWGRLRFSYDLNKP